MQSVKEKKQNVRKELNKTARISGQNPESSDCPLIHIE